jgi:hypothetical protein
MFKDPSKVVVAFYNIEAPILIVGLASEIKVMLSKSREGVARDGLGISDTLRVSLVFKERLMLETVWSGTDA